MDCRGYEERLDELLAGELTAAERRALEDHAAGCARCRELNSLLSVGIDATGPDVPEGFAEAVLEQTSGTQCERALELLCDLVDETLEEPDAGLVAIHLEHCRECRSCAKALARLGEQLPFEAELPPDDRWVHDVLTRTSRSRRRRIAAWRGQLAAGWRRTLARPRFAVEGAYLGSLVLTVAIASTGSPLSGLPGGTVSAARGEMARWAAAPRASAATFAVQVSALENVARETASRRLSAPITEARQKLAGASGALRSLRDRATRAVESWQRDGERPASEPESPAKNDPRKETRS